MGKRQTSEPTRERRFLAPEFVQTSAMDCGPAALACALRGFGVNADYGRLRQMVADLGGELVRDAATDRFAEGLAPLSRPMTDLLVPLRAAGGRQDLFFQRNVHLTPKGHEVVAEHLATFVRSHGL